MPDVLVEDVTVPAVRLLLVDEADVVVAVTIDVDSFFDASSALARADSFGI